MEKWLSDYRQEVLDGLLQFLWRQWAQLGVAGQIGGSDAWVIDPEALLVFSCTMARHDQRLFDEILDWSTKNERFFNIQRLRTILHQEQFAGESVVGAMASCLARRNPPLKWRRLAESGRPRDATTSPRPLFFLKNGAPLPVLGERDAIFLDYGWLRNPVEYRGLSLAFPPKSPAALLLQLRSLIGVGARCETLLYLFLNEKATIQEVAENTYYSWRSIQEVLYELGHSGLLQFPGAKRGRTYRLDGRPWLDILLNDTSTRLRWICWPPLLRALEIIWAKLNDPVLEELSPLGQASEFRSVMVESVNDRIEKSGFGGYVRNPAVYQGEIYREVFLADVRTLLAALLGTSTRRDSN